MTTPTSAPVAIPAPIVMRGENAVPIPSPSRGYVVICSIWPADLRQRMRNHRQKHFFLPAAPRGSYSLLYVHDDGEYSNRPRPDSPEDDWLFLPKPALVIANSLVELWAKNTLGKPSGFYPGIGIIAAEDPTQQELAALRSGQSALFDWYITDGNGKHIRGDHTEITDIHRMAAKEMLDKGAARLPWFHSTEFAAVKDCPACAEQISARAKVCTACKENLIDWYLKYNLDTTEDPAVAEAVARIRLSQENAALKEAVKQQTEAPKDKSPRLAQS